MREKELRIALVFFGGVSLAVYMHGICKEVLKLLRASSALHRITDRTQRARAAFFDEADPNDPEYDTEAEYFELLREIGHKLELRVIVDLIAGASAGGINGVMLARALSHDLPTLPLRDLWLDNADVSVLLAPEARAGTWSKAVLKPFIWGATASGMFGKISDREVRQKVSMFLRSRWFKPPFSGSGMAGLMYDAAVAMGRPKAPTSSLLPSGHDLDLFVTLTDYYGYRQLVEIHDPAVIYELEHRHVLHFKYRRRPSGEVESDFDLDNAPALAFAARATSSFPGRISAGTDHRNGRPGGEPRRRVAAPRGLHPEKFRTTSAGRQRPGDGRLHRRRGAQQSAVARRRGGDPRPLGLSRRRPPSDLRRCQSRYGGRGPAHRAYRTSSRP